MIGGSFTLFHTRSAVGSGTTVRVWWPLGRAGRGGRQTPSDGRRDHLLFHEGIVASTRAAGDITVVGQAEDASSAVRRVRNQLPDLALLDVAVPGDGLDAARMITAACP
jgi:CheY-like chemotaxis protein